MRADPSDDRLRDILGEPLGHGRDDPFRLSTGTGVRDSGLEAPSGNDVQKPPLPPELVRQLSFFQAVRLLEMRVARLLPGHVPVGAGPVTREGLRFKVSTALDFPTTDLASVGWLTEPDGTAQRVALTTHFLGLVGASSPLPLAYAQEVLQDEETHPQLRDFLDVFHHRLLSLLYQSWRVHRPEVSGLTGGDGLVAALGELVGLPPLTPDAEASLRFMGLFSLSTRPGEGLALLLRQSLGLPVTVVPLRLRRVEIPASERVRFGGAERRHRLSRNLVLGRRIWDRSGAIRLELGPLTRGQLEAFAPGGKLLPRLRALVGHYLAQPLDVQVVLRVPPGELPRVRLGGPHKTRLGRLAVLTRAREEVWVRVEK